MNSKFFLAVFVALFAAAPLSPAQVPRINTTDIGLHLQADIAADSVLPFRRLHFTLRNSGPEVQVDPAVKHADLEIPNLELTLTRGNRRFLVIDKKNLRAFTGKVEPVVVTLRTGESYSFDEPLEGFVVVVTGASDPSLEEFARPGDAIRVTFNVKDEIYGLPGKFYGQSCDLVPCWEGSLVTTLTVQ